MTTTTCTRTLTAGEVLTRPCIQCGHLLSAHGQRLGPSGTSCQQCAVDLLLVALQPQLDKLRAESVDDTEKAMFVDWENGFFRYTPSQEPVLCSMCRGLIKTHSMLLHDRAGLPRHGQQQDCQSSPLRAMGPRDINF